MQPAISTACLYPMLLEKSFSTLVSMGFRTFEVFINTFSELQPDYLKTMKKAAEESGSTFYSVHPFTSGYENLLLFSEYERRFTDSLEFYKNYMNACRILGAHILVLHGRRSDKPSISDEEFFERYLRLYDLGSEFGVMVAQENVSKFCSETPAFIRKMRAACGMRCAFVLDVKQAVRAGQDPCEMCDAMGSRIRQVHLNDHDAKSDCRLPGAGAMDYPRLIAQLKRYGYNGCLTIEVYRKSFGKLEELLAAKDVVSKLSNL